MILDGSYVGVIMRVAEYTVDCAVALGAPLGFGRATSCHILGLFFVCQALKYTTATPNYSLLWMKLTSLT